MKSNLYMDIVAIERVSFDSFRKKLEQIISLADNTSLHPFDMCIEKEWIDDFANHVADNINSERDHDNYRYMALWRADEYLEYYDCIFKKLANSETYISEWRLTNLFKSILFYGNKDELIKNRQEAWIMHIIEENAMSDSVIIIFEALSEADIVLRKKHYYYFYL